MILLEITVMLDWLSQSNILLNNKNHFKARRTLDSNVLYISTSVWVLRTPNAGQNMFFMEKAKIYCIDRLGEERSRGRRGGI